MKKRRVCPRPDKAQHRDLFAAKVAARRVARTIIDRGEHFDPLYAYCCGGCARWHLTRRAVWDGHANELVWSVPDELQTWAAQRHAG